MQEKRNTAASRAEIKYLEGRGLGVLGEGQHLITGNQSLIKNMIQTI